MQRPAAGPHCGGQPAPPGPGSRRLSVRSVTLDLDGTLLDTVPDLAEAANAMLAELGLPSRSEDDVRRSVGRGIAHLVARCLPGDRHVDASTQSHAEKLFRNHYGRCNGRRARPYPGVVAGLERLRGLGLPLAVVTNKAQAFAEPLLEATGLAQYFAFTVGGDLLSERKPHPLPLLHACARLGSPPAENLHIGDSRHDAASARASGCPVFLVPYGYNEGEGVRNIDCDAIVATLEDAAAKVVAPAH